MSASPPVLSLSRGLAATFLGALGGAVAPVVLSVAYLVSRWVVSGTTDFDRQADVKNLKEDLLYPIVGCAIVCACAGWATFAPAGPWRFARSLGFIFVVSLSLWFASKFLDLTPPRVRSIEHPLFYPSELLVLITPPVAAAALLTVMRVRRVSTQRTNDRLEGERRDVSPPV